MSQTKKKYLHLLVLILCVGLLIVFAQTGQTNEHPVSTSVRVATVPENNNAGQAPPRFTDLGDGTVRDNQSGLIWLKNANCFGHIVWKDALLEVKKLGSGFTCDDFELKDNSTPGDWRLPTIREFMTLPTNRARIKRPALLNTAGTDQWSEGDPFINVLPQGDYWSSTPIDPSRAWYVSFSSGILGKSEKNLPISVWPVKGKLHNLWLVK